MVIAKPEWFKKKKGFLSYEMTWQGTVYFLCTIAVFFIGLTLPQNIITNLTIGGLFLFLFMDMIMASYKSMDERGKKHYSISMRNAAWGMVITIILGSIFISYIDIKNGLEILIVFTALVGGSIGFITRQKLEKEN